MWLPHYLKFAKRVHLFLSQFCVIWEFSAFTFGSHYSIASTWPFICFLLSVVWYKQTADWKPIQATQRNVSIKYIYSASVHQAIAINSCYCHRFVVAQMRTKHSLEKTFMVGTLEPLEQLTITSIVSSFPKTLKR